VQELLDNPNNGDAAQHAAYALFKKSKVEYAKRVRVEAAKYAETPTAVFMSNAGGTTEEVICL
jgi:ubiquitin-conjugating enzyme E2 I